jgi:hypothetical protein
MRVCWFLFQARQQGLVGIAISKFANSQTLILTSSLFTWTFARYSLSLETFTRVSPDLCFATFVLACLSAFELCIHVQLSKHHHNGVEELHILDSLGRGVCHEVAGTGENNCADFDCELVANSNK